jgi:hypothetical protein
MPYEISNVDVWVSEIENRPGGLARALGDLAAADVNLEFVVGRRLPEKPGFGLVFVAPIKGAAQIRAAKAAGFAKATSMHSVRLQGTDRPGLGARMSGEIAAAGINLRGVTAASIGRKCLVYFSFDTTDDARKAAQVLKKSLA